MPRIAGVLQGQGAQRLTGAFAHQPGRSDEARQRPVEAPKQCHTRLQALQRAGSVKAAELAFEGVDAAEKVIPRRVRRRAVIDMVIAVQDQLVAPAQALVKHVPKARCRRQRMLLVEIRYHQPGHGDLAQGIDCLDEWLVVRPGVRGYVMQYQQQALPAAWGDAGLRHEPVPAAHGQALPGSAPAGH
ncbi:hypothetical protein D3C84_865940 [compost metagenome]